MPTFRDDHEIQWQSSGLTRAAYCRQHDLPYHHSRSWKPSRSLLRSVSEDTGFIEVLSHAHRFPGSPVPMPTLSLPNGVELRIDVGTDPMWIGRVIAAMRPC